MSPTDPFAGRTALVTGGARGVGAAVTRRLARSGARVVVHCFHSYDRARELQAELRGEGARVEVVRGSVARRDHVERVFAEVGGLVGGLDYLVNNAASGAFGTVHDIEDEAVERALDTNFRGAWWCARAARHLMVPRGGGAIVNVSSIGSTLVTGSYAAVGTSKAALEALTRYLAAELAPDRIRVNTASAGLLAGDVAGLFPDAEELSEVVRAATPLGRLGTEEELADVVLFLLSDLARWVTGQNVVADGGLSLGAAMLTPPAQWSARRARLAVPAEPAPAPVPVPAPGTGGSDDGDAIAIVGAGIVVPGATTLDDYWRLLGEGPELFVDSLPERWRAEAFAGADRGDEDKSYQSRSAYVVDPVPDPTGADDGTDPTVEYTARWLRRAVADALHGVRVRSDHRVGCVVGYTPDGNHHLEEVLVVEGVLDALDGLLREDGRPEAEARQVLDRARAALAQRYPRTGVDRSALWPRTVGERAVAGLLPGAAPEILMVDTACSSSLYALDIGVKALQEGRQDVVVCGGSFAVGPRNSVLFAKLNGLSVSGHVRPLDRASDGVLFSDGAAVVVAKRLADARRDGDEVLGYVVSVGSSSDGRGKAIYAPSVDGQRRAVQRARAKAPEVAADVSWVVAHATGTPAGDLCELTALGQEVAAGREVCVTSNKAIIGHTGWAAGVASVIQVLLALRHGSIPRQHRFDGLPARLPETATALHVPTQPVGWPAGEAARVAAVSGFGFGGTNSHVLVSDRPAVPSDAGRAATAADDGQDLALVAWSAVFPGLDGRDAVQAWLAGGQGPAAGFGPVFGAAPRTLRIPPPTQRVLDRCQLMVVSCADQLRGQLGEVWDRNRERTGVFLGHMGPTRSAVSYAKRCYLDDVLSPAPGRAAPVDGDLAARLRERVRAEVPPSTEDSFPGMMPNVIAARISNYFDLHGPNMVVDTGFGSALAALDVAGRYLRSGDVDLALVGGLNGNSTPEVRHVLRALVGADRDVREGAVLFAATTVDRAREWGLPVLATVRAPAPGVAADPGPGASGDRSPDPTYLGGDGALAVLRAVHALAADPTGRVRVRTGGDGAEPATVVDVAGPAPAASQPAAPPQPARAVRRHVTRWQAAQPRSAGAELPVLPATAVVVTATPELLDGLGDAADDPLVLSVVPCPEGPRRRHVRDLDAASVAGVLAGTAPAVAHVRVLTDLEALAPATGALEGDWSRVADLHDLAFLVLQALHGRLAAGGGSVLGLFLGGDDGAVPHPFAGLFSGLLKSVALELPDCRVASVFTTARELGAGLRELAVEAGAAQDLPLAAWRHGVRHVVVVDDVPAVPSPRPALAADDVVVAVGGGHGITAELLREVVSRSRPTVYVLGSTPVDELAPRVQAAGGRDALADRSGFLRRRREQDPGLSVQAANAELERLRRAAQVMHNLAELERRCGPGRVHYRQADVLDRDRLAAVVDEVHARHGRVDLLVHAAGVNRSGALASKPVEAYREVRAVKVGGYCNLRSAFAGRPPRMWCSFGSFIGLTGQVGEADYAAANDFLTTAAASMRQRGQEEFTIGWTLWDEVGMGAHPVTRAFLAKSGVFTRMSTREGLAHFAEELAAGNRSAAMFHLGDAERAAIDAKLPGFLGSAAGPRFYLDRVVERGERHLVAERSFDADRDGYLAEHTVSGVGTLPGLFVPEIAAEAALELLPGMVVVGFRDVVFERFLKLVPASTRTPRRIDATLVASSDAAAAVRVEIAGDVTAPDGRVVQERVRHFGATVVLGRAHPPAPRWPGLGAGRETPVLDPYHVPGSTVHLSGPFVTTRDTRMHPVGKLARYRSPVGPDHPVFGSFVVPSLLLDGLARVAVVDLVAGRYVPVAAPRSVRRIDLYEAGSDGALGARHGELELSVTPAGLDLEAAGASNRFVASTREGRIVAQMHDVTGIVVGHVDAETGAPVDRRVVEQAVRLGDPWRPPVAAL